jgi:hypothetical protein
VKARSHDRAAVAERLDLNVDSVFLEYAEVRSVKDLSGNFGGNRADVQHRRTGSLRARYGGEQKKRDRSDRTHAPGVQGAVWAGPP